MLRVISWKILSKVVETRHISRLAGNNYKFNVQTDQVNDNVNLDKTKHVNFSKSVDEEKLKVTEPTKKPDPETNEDEKLVTRMSEPTVDEERGLPPWLTKVRKCQEMAKGMNSSRHADWEACVNFCFVV